MKPPLTSKIYSDLADLCVGGETLFLAIKVFRNKLEVSSLGKRTYHETINEIYELSEINDPQEFVESLKLEILFG